MLVDFIDTIRGYSGNFYLFFLLKISMLLGIIYLIIQLISLRQKIISNKVLTFSFWLLVGILLTSGIEYFFWVYELLLYIFFPSITLYMRYTFLRICWIVLLIQQLCLAFFIRYFINKKFKLLLYHYLEIAGIIILSFLSMYMAHRYYGHTYRTNFELIIYRTINIFTVFSVIKAIGESFIFLKKRQIPRILLAQFKLLLYFFVLPYEIFNVLSINMFAPMKLIAFKYHFESLATIIFAGAMGFFARRIIGLRFLNLTKYVSMQAYVNFYHDFKEVRSHISTQRTFEDIRMLTQQFLSSTLGINPQSIELYLCDCSLQEMNPTITFFIQEVEKNDEVRALLNEHCIFIADEIELSAFFEEKEAYEYIAHFLKKIEADIFIPLYECTIFIGYIRIARNARPQRLYTNVDRDKILLFDTTISSALLSLRYDIFKKMATHLTDLRADLYYKARVEQHCKEGITTVLHTQGHDIGLLTYKNKELKPLNSHAYSFVQAINEKTPLYADILHVAHSVEKYKAEFTTSTYDKQGRPLKILGVYENGRIIITLVYESLLERLKLPTLLLNDPSDWDYAFYLETTQSGKLINQLIPSSTPFFMRIKIALLKAALQRKAMLVQGMSEDVREIASVIQLISTNEQLHYIRLEQPEEKNEIAQKIFGINQLISAQQPGILSQLHYKGILLIENIHFLSLATQEGLADIIQYDYFYPLHAKYRIPCAIRIVVSTLQDLKELVDKGVFSERLYTLLKEVQLVIPSLALLPSEELQSLIEGYVTHLTFPFTVTLAEGDKRHLMIQPPSSMMLLKRQVLKLLNEQSLPVNNAQSVESYIVTAKKLGKEALKDPQLMALLWKTFKNQSRIAALLHVDRSSVHRRCKSLQLNTLG